MKLLRLQLPIRVVELSCYLSNSQSCTMLTRQKHSYSQLLQSETPLQLKPHLRSISDFFSLETTLKVLGVFFWSIFTLTTGFVLGTSVGAPCTSELSNSRIHRQYSVIYYPLFFYPISKGFLGLQKYNPDFYVVPTISQTFHYNRTFAEIPSDTSNKAWESLFPPHGGFFDISGVSSQRSTLSIFHQLHCLVSFQFLHRTFHPLHYSSLCQLTLYLGWNTSQLLESLSRHAFKHFVQ